MASSAPSWPGGDHQVAQDVEVKDVLLEGDHLVTCYNPEQAVRDAAVRQRMLQRVEGELGGSDQPSAENLSELLDKLKLKTKPGLGQLLRVTKRGGL